MEQLESLETKISDLETDLTDFIDDRLTQLSFALTGKQVAKTPGEDPPTETPGGGLQRPPSGSDPSVSPKPVRAPKVISKLKS